MPPPLPSRRRTAPGDEPTPTVAFSSEKLSAAQRLPPPPTRTIGLGDKLPPARRAAVDESSDESGEEAAEDPKARLADSMPDASRASRRPPRLTPYACSEREIAVPAYHGGVLVSGALFVVATHHHVRVYDLARNEKLAWALDGRDVGLGKDLKVSAMEWAPGGRTAWLGTKDGHLFELDVRAQVVTGQRLVAHGCAVSHILRHGRAMVTLDEIGKALVFEPAEDADAGEDGMLLAHTPPRVVRIAERQEFARIFAGKLWTSAREAAGRGAVVRIYDVFVPGSVGRTVLPSEHVGAVTAGAVVPSDPARVYLGHEAGVVSIWDAGGDGALPSCVEIVKIGASDVLAMEGVHDRLWIGGRKGTISAYDVAPRPWVLAAGWTAHDSLPVTRLAVDVLGLRETGRCVVVSVGRDEHVGVWDGMLGLNWVDDELLKQETHFASFRPLTVLISTWNIDAARPEHLSGTPANVSFLTDVLRSTESPDILAFGFQEMIDLESRKMAAKTVLLGGRKAGAAAANGGEISEKVTSAYKRWYDRLVIAVRLAMPPECPYTVIHTENLVGLFTCIFVKNSERVNLRDVAVTTVKRGMGGRYGNKGAIVARLVVDDSSVCFINCHLAAGQHHVRQRNADIVGILEECVFDESDAGTDSVAYVGGGDGSMVLDHEIVFLNGDMNYRIDARRDVVIAATAAGDYQALLTHDQLLKEMRFNRGFRLRTFREGALDFAPTYKYDRRTDTYDSSEKRRTPAWCDRVLWRVRDQARVQLLSYRRYEANVSDHRPVSAAFRVRVKSVRMDERARVKREVDGAWHEREREMVRHLVEFYVDQRVL
ncbi:Endonuclease/exonuclease/phosphatase [Vararia minispora EC-137]|uniref:Endonuclease/exonuclease/phosphatase n=1 Tax=Vararia minispora EC-137 TaxID=1314806 RepID=A0ACB8QFG8_9AGAM|nr:Endonuclease/exonuclease/phosphatase [Vararia minispora EC-137]